MPLTLYRRRVPDILWTAIFGFLIAVGLGGIWYAIELWPFFPFLMPMSLFIVVTLSLVLYPVLYSLFRPDVLVLDQVGVTLHATGWTYRVLWAEVERAGGVEGDILGGAVVDLLL